MNISMQPNKPANVILIVLLTLLTLLSGCASTRTSGPAADGTLFVKGRAIKISTHDDLTTIKIKPAKGDVVIVQVTPTTKLEDLKSIAELIKRTPVEVRYRVEGENNIAVLLTKLSEESCG
jgi:hypothetical protein